VLVANLWPTSRVCFLPRERLQHPSLVLIEGRSMRGSSEQRSHPAVRAVLWQGGLVALWFLAAFAGPATAGDPPAANKPAVLSKSQRTKLLTERNRLWREANRLRDEGKVGEAIPAARQMLAIERQLFGNANAGVVQSLDWLAQSHVMRDEFEAARTARQEASAICTKLYGDKDWRTADARQALQDVELRSRLTPDERRRLADADEVISHFQALIPKGEAGIALAERAVETRRKILGESHPDTAAGLHNLAVLYVIRGKYAKAEPLYRQALEIRKKVRGEKHRDTAATLNNLGWMYTLMHEYSKADPLLRQALDIRTKVLGPTDPSTVQSLNNLVGLYKSTKDYPKAEALLLGALADCKKAQGEAHPDYAVSLTRLGAFYFDTRAYAKGEPLYRRALEIKRKVLGENHLDTAECLTNLASLYRALGDYAKTEPLFRQALKIDKKNLGETHPRYATDLNNLAMLYWSLGEYAKAEPLYRQALEIRKKVLGENHADTATSLNNLAELYRSMGDYTRAEPLYRQALKIHKKALGETHPRYATNLSNLAILYSSLGEYAKAEPLYRQALEIMKKVLGENHPDTATSLNNLAELYRSMGDYTRAEPLYRQALETNKKALGENHPDTAAILNNLALLYDSLGDYAKAEPLYRQALEIKKKALGENHPGTALSLNNLAALYQSLGDYAKAEPLCRQALEINRKVLGENHPDTARSLNNLAALYVSLGDYAKAEPLHRQALEIRKKVLGGNHADTATSLNNLAELYWSLGDYPKAEPLYRQALEINRKVLGENHPDTARSLNNLAALYVSLGDYAKAEPLCQQALEISLGGLRHNFGILSERQQLALESSSQGSLNGYLSLASAAGISDGAVYAYVLESKGAVTARQALVRLERRRPDLKHLFDELQTVGARLANLSLSGADPKHPEVRLQTIEALTEQKEVLEGKLAAQYHAFAQTREAARLGRDEQLRKLQAAIPAQTALVDVLEYTHIAPPSAKKGPFESERRLVAFVVRSAADAKKQRAVTRIELGPTRAVTRAVEGWRQVAVDPGVPRTNGLEFLQQLRTLVWDKLEPALVGAETILVSPDGPLCRFPLGALPGSKPDTYLVEERTIVVIPLPRLLPQLAASGTADRSPTVAESLLMVGDVDYGGSPGQADMLATRSAPRSQSLHGFRKLEHSAAEIASIRDSFEQRFDHGSVRFLRKEKATESAFREQAPEFRWLHLATHGFYDPPELRELRHAQAPHERGDRTQGLFERGGIAGYNPGLLSGLALAGANRQSVNAGEDDGILTALEVSSLDLSGVELAVLSACETGLGSTAGATAGGEGLLGLQRAFQMAGAQTVMAGLWRVPDRETMLLMQRFYRNLWDKKLPKAQALREAQIWLLRDGKPPRGLDVPDENANPSKRLLPKYWAAFVISGDWR
jgi:tetratricopeptide (TPR) repeat protein/CHAT domain-containing protein